MVIGWVRKSPQICWRNIGMVLYQFHRECFTCLAVKYIFWDCQAFFFHLTLASYPINPFGGTYWIEMAYTQDFLENTLRLPWGHSDASLKLPWGCAGIIEKCAEGQIILECLFGVFNFLQKTNNLRFHSSKVEFVRSFFGGNIYILGKIISTFSDL